MKNLGFWKKYFIALVLAIILVAVIGQVSGTDPEKFGEGGGRLIGIVFGGIALWRGINALVRKTKKTPPVA